MTYTSSQTGVGTTPTRLDSGTTNRTLTLRFKGTVFLGGAGVTAATGCQFVTGEDYIDTLTGTDGLYAITASGSATVHVLQKAV